MPQEGYPNLIGPGDRSPDEARANGEKGGKASGVSRRRRKTFAEGLKEILAMDVDDPKVLEALKTLGLAGTFQDAINLQQIRQSIKGDTESARFVRDTVGEKPREGLEIGNLDDKPFESLDLTKLSDEQLRELAARKAESHE
jgi:hypothetical protein